MSEKPAKHGSPSPRWGNLARQLGPEAIEKLHRRVVEIAQESQIAEGRKMRVDTTVVDIDFRARVKTEQHANLALAEATATVSFKHNRFEGSARWVFSRGDQATGQFFRSLQR